MPYSAPAAKTGNGLLDLLKEPHKDLTEMYERDALSHLYSIAGFHGGGPPANGTLPVQVAATMGAVFPPPPPRGPEDKPTSQSAALRGAEMEKLGRQLHAAQHLRNPVEMPSAKNEAGTQQAFNTFAQAHLELASAYQTSIYNPYHPVKFLHQQNTAHLQRGRMESGLQRTRSEPNIGDLCPKKKDKNTVKRYQAPFHVQHPKAFPSQPVVDEEHKIVKPKEPSPVQKQTATGGSVLCAKALDVLRPPPGKKEKPTSVVSSLEQLKLNDDVLERLNVMERRRKAAEKEKNSESSEGEKDPPLGKDTDETSSKETETKDEVTTTTEKTRPAATDAQRSTLPTHSDVHDQSIVIGEPPEPPSVDYHQRMDREFFATSRSMNRRSGRPFDLHHTNMHSAEMRNSLLQMAQGQRQQLTRMGLGERQMQATVEMRPNGELVPSFAPVYPYIFNAAATNQFSQTPLYGILSAQGDLTAAQMTPARAMMPTGAIRHPAVAMPKADARNALVDLFPNSHQPSQWFRPDVSPTADRRMNGGMPLTLPPGWTTPYTTVNLNGSSRPREEIPVRDSDDVLSGDIETLTQHLEVARNFIGCKTSVPSSDKERSSRASSAGQTPERTRPSAGHRKGTPSPTLTNRQDSRGSSRERLPKSQMENPSIYSHPPPVPPGGPVGYPGNYPAQPPNVLYQVPPGLVTHPPPPPGAVHERMSNENELLAQLHGNVNLVAPGYSYQGSMRGVHLPMTHVNLAANGVHPQGTMPHPTTVDPANLQLPPQPPHSASPARVKDSQVIRSTKAPGGSRPMTAEDSQRPISLLTDGTGITVEIDNSVLQAVKAAMAEKASDEHQASRDPNNRTSQGDPNSPRHGTEEAAVHLRGGGGLPDPPMHGLTNRRQLEQGVICYSEPKDFSAQSNRHSMGGEFNAAGANGHLAHFFTMSAPAPTTPSPADLPIPPRSEHIWWMRRCLMQRSVFSWHDVLWNRKLHSKKRTVRDRTAKITRTGRKGFSGSTLPFLRHRAPLPEWNVSGGSDNGRQCRRWLEYTFRIERF